jgi:hypothetical protein
MNFGGLALIMFFCLLFTFHLIALSLQIVAYLRFILLFSIDELARGGQKKRH